MATKKKSTKAAEKKDKEEAASPEVKIALDGPQDPDVRKAMKLD